MTTYASEVGKLATSEGSPNIPCDGNLQLWPLGPMIFATAA